MCSTKDSFDPVVLSDVEGYSGIRIYVMSENRNYRIAFVKNDKASVEIGNGDIVTLYGNGGRHPEASDDFGYKMAIKIVVYQTPFGLMISVANQKTGWFVPCIQSHSMCGVEFFQTISLLTEVSKIVSLLVILKNLVTGISICQVNHSVWGYRDGSRSEFFRIQPRFIGKSKTQYNLAVTGSKFDSLTVIVASSVDIFNSGLFANFQIMNIRILLAEK